MDESVRKGWDGMSRMRHRGRMSIWNNYHSRIRLIYPRFARSPAAPSCRAVALAKAEVPQAGTKEGCFAVASSGSQLALQPKQQ